ncbi:response regulator [Desulfobacterales bacterium HSG2]|nr:response regulator [Desulfobacterales bacterium HSG2]
MKHAKQTILIVDDDPSSINILVNILSPDYEIIVAKNGSQALTLARFSPGPDLILLDIMMPDMDGYEVCQNLKAEPDTRDIPIIFVTTMDQEVNEFEGLELGAIDYLTKPVCPPVVRARVRNHLKLRAAMLELERLNRLALDANPNTGLPGNNSIANAITKALKDKEAVCVIYADIDYFKAFNDKYGFARGDEVIRFTSRILKASVESANCPDAFIGHIGGDDFVLLVPRSECDKVADSIISRFDLGIPDFYDPEDARAKCIRTLNRRGEETTFSLMSVSMGGVNLAARTFCQYLEVSDTCAELKKKAKTVQGSTFLLDRRK